MRPLRRFLGVAFALALFVLAALGASAWRVAQVRADVREAAEAAVAEVVAAVRAQTAGVMTALHEGASEIASAPMIRRALADTTAVVPVRTGSVLGRVIGEGDAYRSVEVYRADGALLAWDGFTAPFGPAAARGIPDTLRSGVVRDGTGRRLLVLWVPVWAGDRHLGAVRMVRLAQVEVPVRNQYLRDYDLADEWRGEIALPFGVAFTGRLRAFRGEAERIVGPDGATLGWVAVPPPNERSLVGRARGEGRHVVAFGLVLLGGWLLIGGWMVVERAMRRALRRGSAERPGWGVAGAILVGWVVAWGAARYGLLALDVPARWIERGGAGAALFDPLYLASDVGGGLLRSAGDLAVTALWAAVTAVALLRFALVRTTATLRHRPRPVRPHRAVLGVLASVLLAGGVVAAFAVGVRHAVLDATLGYFARSGPVPDPLTFVVLASLLAGAFATTGVVAAAVILGRRALGGRRRVRQGLTAVGLGLIGLSLVVAAVATPLSEVPPWAVAPLLAVAGGAAAIFLLGRRDRWAWPLTFRGMLTCVLVLVPLTYLLMLHASRERQESVMMAAAADFATGQDRRAVYALEQVLAEARSAEVRPALVAAVDAARQGRALVPDTTAIAESATPDEADDPVAEDTLQATLDELVSDLVAGSLLASLAEYDVRLVLFTPGADSLAATPASSEEAGGLDGLQSDPLAFPALRARYVEREGETGGGIYLARVPVEGRRGAYRYAGIAPLRAAPDIAPVAWLYARVAPRLSRFVAETPFPRVLVPAGLFGEDDESFSYAEYDDGVLVRGAGEVTGPSRIRPEVQALLDGEDAPRAVWLRETLDGRGFRTFYRRLPDDPEGGRGVVVVRAPTTAVYDHLFFLLRLTVAGLGLGLVVYLVGVPVRWRAGLLPAPRSRFRDKVLTRFLLVGIASVAITGVIGQQVIAEQNEQAVRDVLRQRLQRAEAEVLAAAGPDTPVAAALERARADLISQGLRVDVHVYQGPQLVSTSRPQLVRQRLIDPRLPAEVWSALFAEGQRYAFAQDRIGSFGYTTGYVAVADEEGRPVGAVAVPTLPEQAAIEAEQARMIAYLFGALLVLLIGIFATTALLANQLTRPFRRLRAGLQAVGAGQMNEPLPVESRDEMGELVSTFNRMQGQLVESRRRLAQQERELAWREMARQVAHEIKNPLTPMKLSVQHLRRAFRPPGEAATPEEQRFAGTLERITTTLIEQIDALDRIAGEFSSFARLPRRSPEPLDLNAVVQEAAALFESEAGASGALPAVLRLDLAAAPLPVEADREELRRVFINLFKNALQAMPEPPSAPRRTGRITTRTWRDEAHAWAEVEDTGTGIPEGVREKIFQPNFSTKTSGMGLGLAIVQKSVEASGGAISFETAEGQGTTFVIRLPLLPVGDGAGAGDGAP
ncbi:MAG: ATP-binding protein [Rubricoccaceae bacterium]|nr:ATP-binding protein [Rubricoccaceae bacterium]